MNITVIGAGGVGAYFGGRLAQAGNQITFIARGEHLKAIKENGLAIKSIKGDFVIHPALATDNLSAITEPDLILVCVKAWQVKDIAQAIKPYLGEHTAVMPLQNGVLAAKELAKVLPPDQIINGLCRIFSLIEKPGTIVHKGIEPTIIFGEHNNAKTERAANIKNLFDKAGITNIWADDIEAEMWKKFLMICSSALLAVTRTTYGELRSITETRQLLLELFTEIYQVALASGIKLNSDIVEKTMKAVDTFPPDSTSSLTRDVWEGKPSEIEYQNGTVVRLGEKLNVQTPVNRFVYNAVIPSELKARK